MSYDGWGRVPTLQSKSSNWPVILAGVVCAVFGIGWAACPYVNGRGDANKFAAAWISENLPDATRTSHTCQSRDTDNNGYVTCTVSATFIGDTRPEIIPLECGVNRVGTGCNVEGCRPLATFRVRR